MPSDPQKPTLRRIKRPRGPRLHVPSFCFGVIVTAAVAIFTQFQAASSGLGHRSADTPLSALCATLWR